MKRLFVIVSIFVLRFVLVSCSKKEQLTTQQIVDKLKTTILYRSYKSLYMMKIATKMDY